jgi:hypothetical protein
MIAYYWETSKHGPVSSSPHPYLQTQVCHAQRKLGEIFKIRQQILKDIKK